MIRLGLLLVIPVAPVMKYLFDVPSLWVFVAGIVSIAVLAEWIRVTTDDLALHTGPAIGGLLTISLGSLAELLLTLFVLMRGETAVVHAQITGSIMATSLLGLGLAMVVGGIGRERQSFKRERAGLLSSLLILAVVALLLPAVFDFAGRTSANEASMAANDEQLSLAVSVVLLALYGGNLIYTLITHRDVFSTGAHGDKEPRWPLWRGLLTLGVATALAALEAELVSGALTAAAGSLGLSTIFVGVVVLAVVGTAADLFAAVFFARQDQMGLTMSICIGSTIQVALVVAPLLVIISWWLGSPMTLVFHNPLDLFAIAGTVFVVNSLAGDGETTWFEGVMLIGVYIVLGAAYYFV